MNKINTGRVERGVFIPDDKAGYVVSICRFEGKQVEEVIRLKQRNKGKQYRYLYGVVYKLISDELGYIPDEVDYLMKLKFHFQVKLGVRIPILGGKKKMSTELFTTYIDNIRKWAHVYFEGRVYIPEPGEVDLE